jgi:hypothetical protein
MRHDESLIAIGIEQALLGIGLLAEIVGELIPESRPDLMERLSGFLQMSAAVLEDSVEDDQ